jgi:excinuclease ABC subunit C
MTAAANGLQQRLDLLPPSPGVYLIKGPDDTIIYIGKPKNLRNRVRSYFTESASGNHFALHVLKDKASDIDWIITGNEVEALILEANLVKKHSPRYNVMLKDDKHFPYLKLSLSEPFPRITVTRQVARGKDLYFGPYTEARAMRKTINTIYKIFRIRDCGIDLPLKKPLRPCLTYHIGRCDAPCAGLCSVSEYQKLVSGAVLLLKGKNPTLMKTLHRNMMEASEKKRYEEAARYRDQMVNMERILKRQKVDLGKDKRSRDLIAIARDGSIGCAVVLQIRSGILIDKKHFELICPREHDDTQIITHFLKGFYHQKDLIPREIIISRPPESEENLEKVLSDMSGVKVTIKLPIRGNKKHQISLALNNAKMSLADFVYRYETRNRLSYSVICLQQDLHLKKPPHRIEAVDVSHLSGTDTVASIVVFKDGKPLKKEYRKYTIKSVSGINDVESINEVIQRRISRITKEGLIPPDLFIIDGGKPQLNAAVKAIRKNHLSVPVIAIAKKLENIFFPGKIEPLPIPKSSYSSNLIQSIRNESHRFAITFQKSRRKKYLRKTWLDDVPGIGPHTINKILRKIKYPDAIFKLSPGEVEKIVGKSKAQKILSRNIESFS